MIANCPELGYRADVTDVSLGCRRDCWPYFFCRWLPGGARMRCGDQSAVPAAVADLRIELTGGFMPNRPHEADRENLRSTTEEALDAAIAAGADMIGFSSFRPSPRYLTLERATALASRAAGADGDRGPDCRHTRPHARRDRRGACGPTGCSSTATRAPDRYG